MTPLLRNSRAGTLPRARNQTAMSLQEAILTAKGAKAIFWTNWHVLNLELGGGHVE